MMEVMPESSGNLLALKLSGHLTDEDYKNIFIPEVNRLLGEHDKIRAVCIVDKDFKQVDIGAMWDDSIFGTRHRNDFEKLAVVGGSGFMRWGTKLLSHFMEGQVKVFSSDEEEQAWEWIKA